MAVTPDQPDILGWVIVVAAALWARHEWHLRRYPDRACGKCGGSGTITSSDILTRKVVGPCPRCKGQRPTSPRRTWARR